MERVSRRALQLEKCGEISNVGIFPPSQSRFCQRSSAAVLSLSTIFFGQRLAEKSTFINLNWVDLWPIKTLPIKKVKTMAFLRET